MPIPGYNANCYIASGPLSLTNEAMADTGDHATFRVTNTAHRGLSTDTAIAVQAKWDEVWTVTIANATGGTFTLTFGSQTTSGIAYNAAASAVQAAFTALSSVGSGNASVSGSNGGPYTIEFIGTLAYANQGNITANGASLTGSSPTVTPAKVQDGQGFVTQSASLYKIQYPVGQIVFTTALTGTPVCQIASGKYIPFSFLAYAKAEEIAFANKVIDISSQKNPPSAWEDYLPGPNSSTVKISKLWIDGTYLAALDASTLLILKILPDANQTPYWAGYGTLTSDAIKSAKDSANTEDLQFSVNGQMYYALN